MRLNSLNLPRPTTQSTPLKIYCDASHQENGMSFAGWVFCNHNGKQMDISGTALGKGWCSVTAEMESVTRVLDGISHYDFVSHVNVYCDCEPAVEQLQDDFELESSFEHVSVKWIPRSENQIADLVADGFMAKHWSSPERKVTEP